MPRASVVPLWLSLLRPTPTTLLQPTATAVQPLPYTHYTAPTYTHCLPALLLTLSATLFLLSDFLLEYFCYRPLLYSAILRSRADSLRSHMILHEWIAFYCAFLCFLRISTKVVYLQRWRGWYYHMNCCRLSAFCVHHTTMHHVTSCHFMQSHKAKQNKTTATTTMTKNTKERYQHTTSVDINNTRCKRIQSLIQNHMPMWALSLLESRE